MNEIDNTGISDGVQRSLVYIPVPVHGLGMAASPVSHRVCRLQGFVA